MQVSCPCVLRLGSVAYRTQPACRPSDGRQLASFTLTHVTHLCETSHKLTRHTSSQVHTVKTTLSALAEATTASGSDLLPPLRNPPLLEATEDLTNLSYLNEPAGETTHAKKTLDTIWPKLTHVLPSFPYPVLHTILHRYSLRQVYTYSGIVLVAVNPFSSLSVYESSIVQAYAGRRKGELEPHLFAIAEEAYRCMIGTSGEPGGNQTIVVSGER